MTSATTDLIVGTSGSAAMKNPVKAATTANITLSGEQTIDGISCVTDDRVLVKNQTTTTQNGIYYVSTGSWTRTPDFDGARDVVTGTTVFVYSGTDNGGEYWYVSTSGDPDPGEAMAFTQAPLAASGVTLGTIATQNANAVAITGGSIAGITDLAVADGGTGASSLTSNALLKGNGTSAVQASGITVDSNNQIYGFKANFNDQTGTSYTLLSTDSGKTVTLTNGSAITVTLPNDLAIGFECECIQGGAGQVTFTAAGGATLQNRSSHTKIAGQYGAVRLKVVTNSGGSSAVYNLAGDTAT